MVADGIGLRASSFAGLGAHREVVDAERPRLGPMVPELGLYWWSCRESNPCLDLRKCGLTFVGLRHSTSDSAKVPGNYAEVVGESNMSTMLAVVPRVFAGLPLIWNSRRAIELNRTLVAERRTGRPLIESEKCVGAPNCVTPKNIYGVVYIGF